MRMMIKFVFPTDAGNAAIREGKITKGFQALSEELKPEAAYFFPEGGEWAGVFIVHLKKSSQIAEIAERVFFGLSARVEMVPVMALEDLQKGLSGVPGTMNNPG